MKRPIDISIRSIPMDSLKKYYEPEEITGYCKTRPPMADSNSYSTIPAISALLGCVRWHWGI